MAPNGSGDHSATADAPTESYPTRFVAHANSAGMVTKTNVDAQATVIEAGNRYAYGGNTGRLTNRNISVFSDASCRWSQREVYGYWIFLSCQHH